MVSHAVWKVGSRALGREELSHTICSDVETTAGNATQKSSQRMAWREITGTPQLGFGLNQNTRFACILANRRWPVPAWLRYGSFLLIYFSWSYYPPCASCLQGLGEMVGGGREEPSFFPKRDHVLQVGAL